MIVKNESNIILRCLNSCKDYVDSIYITDTGSTDNTIDLIENFLSENKIKGKVFKSKLKQEFNFQDYRNESYQNAVKELKKDYFILLLDADMVLRSNISKDEIKRSIYGYTVCELNQVEGSNVYSNIRFLNGNYKWECKCLTHEFWKTSTIFPSELIIPPDKVYIEDLSDGNNKKDKSERDLRLLLRGYDQEKESEIKSRYEFYIALTYYALEMKEKSIEWFKKRISSGNWIEEVYYSKYMIARILNIRDAYIDAWLYNPNRAEPLYWLCMMEMNYNIFNDDKFITQKCILVWMYCKWIVRLSIPRCKLFIEKDIYDYKIKYLMYICSFYARDEEGKKFYNELVRNSDVGKAVVNFKEKYGW